MMIPDHIDYSYSYGSISELVARKQTHEDLDFMARKKLSLCMCFPCVKCFNFKDVT